MLFGKSFIMLALTGLHSKPGVLCSGSSFSKEKVMTKQKDLFGDPVEEGTVIYTMTIRLKSGKVIRRPNGRPFRIVIRPKK